MGNASDEESISSKKQSFRNNHQIKKKLKILILIITTNLISIYVFTSPHMISLQNPISRLSQQRPIDTSNLLLKLDETEQDLTKSRSQIAEHQRQLKATRSFIKHLLSQISNLNNKGHADSQRNKTASDLDDLLETLSKEAKLSIGPHRLPFGFTQQIGSDELYSSTGGGCLKHEHDLDTYMSYNVGEECPVDDTFAQRLMLEGCEPLPRRRCHPKSPSGYLEPAPLPQSLWTTPPDQTLIWDAYTCKSYSCLIERIHKPGFSDCKDCFHLEGKEKTRWLFDNGGLEFGIDGVLATRPKGTIRIGLDIGGGSGTFAARMRERDVTIVTTSMNFDGPFNSFISSRGLISMHVTISQRFPFFENTLDIVHSMHVLSNWIPDTMLEFLLYDVYRVLRPGGLFWLDRFFCFGTQLNATYVPMFDRIGFKRLRWYSGMKLDKGIEKNEWYFSALFEKPLS